MFGLMKRAERLAYCGSCKTIEAMYGQRARLLLNHEKSGQPEWTEAHRSFNCMAMPKEHPQALRYAGTAAVEGDKAFFSPAYRRAASWLRASGFPLDEMTALLRTQGERRRGRFRLPMSRSLRRGCGDDFFVWGRIERLPAP